MSAATFTAQATMRPEAFCDEIDERLERIGQAPAQWSELEPLYRDGIWIPVAVRIVLRRRQCK